MPNKTITVRLLASLATTEFSPTSKGSIVTVPAAVGESLIRFGKAEKVDTASAPASKRKKQTSAKAQKRTKR
jgi:hypothetical protein